MNKAELHEAVASHLGGSKADAVRAVDAVLHTIQHAVADGEKVVITGFGIFEKVVKPARNVRNPRTGEVTMAAETAVPKFRAGAGFKSTVAGS